MNGEITPKPHKGQNPMDRVVVHKPNEPLERTFFALTYEAQLQSWLPELYVISGHYISKKLFINKREDKEVFVQIEERCYINGQLFNLYLLREVWKNKSESDRGREIILRMHERLEKRRKKAMKLSFDVKLWWVWVQATARQFWWFILIMIYLTSIFSLWMMTCNQKEGA